MSTSIINDPALVSKVEELWRMNLKYEEMLRVLQEFEGYPELSTLQLRRLRYKHQFFNASRTNEQKEKAREAAIQEVWHQLEIGQSTRYGQTNAHINIRHFGRVFVSKHAVTAATKALDPKGVDFR